MGEQLKAKPLCPSCGKPMRLARIVPGFASLPELHTYHCKGCGVAETNAISASERRESIDPLC